MRQTFVKSMQGLACKYEYFSYFCKHKIIIFNPYNEQKEKTAPTL